MLLITVFFHSETEERRGAAARIKSILCEVRDSAGPETGIEKQWPSTGDFFSCGYSFLTWSFAQEIFIWSNLDEQCSKSRTR